MHINTHNKESLTQRCRRSTNVQLCLIFLYLCGLSLNGWHASFCITNNRHNVTITTHAIMRHFLIWMTMVRQTMKRRCSCVLTLKYIFICVYWWTRQRIHNTLIVVDQYLWLTGDEMIPDSAEPRLELFYPPFVAGIDLPHQGVEILIICIFNNMVVYGLVTQGIRPSTIMALTSYLGIFWFQNQMGWHIITWICTHVFFE